MDIRLPNGDTLKDVPEGTTKAQLVNKLQAAGMGDVFASVQERAALDPTKGMSGGERFLAGAGKAFSDINRGAAQLMQPVRVLEGLAGKPIEAPEPEAEIRARDQPLMRTGAGLAGNIAGNVAAMLPAAAVPGGATLAGAGATGGLLGALQPVSQGESRAVNVAIGGALGAGGQAGIGAIARQLTRRSAAKAAQASATAAQRAIRDATLKEAQQAGYVIPPSAVNPSFATKRLEGVAGKAAIGQEATVRNQQVTNDLARKALGLPKDTPLSEKTLEVLRADQGRVYAEVAKVSKRAETTLEQLKDARFESKAYWKHYNTSADPNSLRNARHFDQQIKQLETTLEQEATSAGKANLIPELRSARKQIAKSYDVEKALNLATGDIDARVIGRLLDRAGEKAITGELATIGKFAEAFTPYAREGAKIPTPGVSKLEALTSLGLAMGGLGLAGPVGLLAAAAPLISGPVRAGLLSRTGQRMLAQPPPPGRAPNPLVAALRNEERMKMLGRSVAPAAYLAGE